MAAPAKPALPGRILIAVGGNATHPEEIRGTAGEQKEIAARTARALLPLALADNELVIVHGNGPVVGKILMRQALTASRVPPMPLDICVAHSQGGIAYLLMQAIDNLVGNAITLTPRGGRVVCEAGPGEAGGAIMSISDQGPGLTQAEIDRLFQPFARAHAASDGERRSTGLGLWIVRLIAERHAVAGSAFTYLDFFGQQLHVFTHLKCVAAGFLKLLYAGFHLCRRKRIIQQGTHHSLTALQVCQHTAEISGEGLRILCSRPDTGDRQLYIFCHRTIRQ